MEIGSWDKLPHYAVIGTPADMYVWINEDGHGANTRWIKGREAFGLWHKFRKLSNNNQAFADLAKKVFKQYQ